MENKLWSNYDELRERLNSILSTLSQREQDVLKMRFGLDDGRCHDFKEVGERFGMTRTEVRVVEVKALRRLREVGKELSQGLERERSSEQEVRRVYVTQKDCGDATAAERREANKRVWDYVGKFFFQRRSLIFYRFYTIIFIHMDCSSCVFQECKY